MTGNDRIEDLLKLCYESVVGLGKGLYLVEQEHDIGIVDKENNVVYEFINKHFNSIIPGGENFIFIEESCGEFTVYTLEPFRKTDKVWLDVKRATEYSWIVRAKKLGGYGLMNALGKIILPCRYSILFRRFGAASNRELFTGALMNNRYDAINYNQLRYLEESEGIKYSSIILNKECTSFDCYEAVESGIDGVQIVTTGFDRFGPMENLSKRKKSRINGIIVGKDYSDFLVEKNLLRFGMIRTYNYNSHEKYSYTGIVDLDGDEIVGCTKYNLCDYIGNGIFAIGNREGAGVYADGTEIVTVGTLKQTYPLIGKVPVQMAITQEDEQVMIGNDGNTYRNLEEAFPLYKSTVADDVYLINVYGNWVYMDSKLNIITNISDKNVLVRENWIKL